MHNLMKGAVLVGQDVGAVVKWVAVSVVLPVAVAFGIATAIATFLTWVN